MASRSRGDHVPTRRALPPRSCRLTGPLLVRSPDPAPTAHGALAASEGRTIETAPLIGGANSGAWRQAKAIMSTFKPSILCRFGDSSCDVFHGLGAMTGSVALSSYEKERLAKIEENKRLLETLQLNEAVAALEAHCTKAVEAARPAKRPSAKTQVNRRRVGGTTIRRSRRLIGKRPIYNETILCQEISGRRRLGRRRRVVEATREEVYTEEHTQLLGSYDKEWLLFVDGYDKHGMRLWDSVRGKTCHQCRQKTLAKHTDCSKCHTLKGCLCGDCLFMRYGENVDEVKAKEDWICPCCRDICNCSFCRVAKGWAPTGPMYRKAVVEGYKSVAHYLILRRQEDKENAVPTDKTQRDVRSRGVTTRSMGAALNTD